MIVVFDPKSLAVHHVINFHMPDYHEHLDAAGQSYVQTDVQLPHNEIEVFHDGEKHDVRRREVVPPPPPVVDVEAERRYAAFQINHHFETAGRTVVPTPTLALARAMRHGADTALLDQLVAIDDERLTVLTRLGTLDSVDDIHQLAGQFSTPISRG